MQGLLTEERGSTRLGATIAIGALLILGVAGVPMVLSQSHNAQDAKARSTLTRLAGHVETCRVSADSYRDCDERSELAEDRTVHWGDHAGQAGTLTDRSEDNAFIAYAVSDSGGRVYVWASRDGHVDKRHCEGGSTLRLARGGCGDSRW